MVEPVVSAQSLSKSFGSKQVLRDISVGAEPGDIIGVLGKNGAGKTTLLEVLLGFSPPTSGHTSVFGEDSMKLSEAAKARIGFVPQQDELITLLTGGQQLKITRAFYKHWDTALIDRLLVEWEVPMNRRMGKLSVGERQKLSLLLALGHGPELVVLDEPVASLDPIARRDFLRQIVDISSDERRSVLFSSHIVSDLERVANKVWIVKDGRLIWQSGVDELKESVVRLHIRAKAVLPPDLGIDHALSVRVDGERATVAVADWQPDQRQALAETLHAEIEVEALGLEDIFMELHG